MGDSDGSSKCLCPWLDQVSCNLSRRLTSYTLQSGETIYTIITRHRYDRWWCQQLATMLSDAQTTVTISAGVWWCLVPLPTAIISSNFLSYFVHQLFATQDAIDSKSKSNSNNSNRSIRGTAKVFWWQDSHERAFLPIEFLYCARRTWTVSGRRSD